MNKIQEQIKLAAQARINLMLWGKQGIGKSTIVGALKDELCLADVKTLILSQRDPVDLIGMPRTVEVESPYKRGQKTIVSTNAMPDWLYDMWQKHNAAKARGESGQCLLFADEVNRGDRYAHNAFMQITLENRIGEHQLPPNTILVAACNPESDTEQGITEFGDAFMDRWSHLPIHGEGDAEFFDYVKAANWNETVGDFLKQSPKFVTPDSLDFSKIEANIKASRRSWDAVQRLMTVVGNNKAVFQNYAYDIIKGLVGREVANEFAKYFTDTFDRVIEPADILAGKKDVLKKLEKWVLEGKMGAISATVEKTRDYIHDTYKKPSDIPAAQVKNFLKFIKACPKDLQVGFLGGLAGLAPEKVGFWNDFVSDGGALPKEAIDDLRDVLNNLA